MSNSPVRRSGMALVNEGSHRCSRKKFTFAVSVSSADRVSCV